MHDRLKGPRGPLLNHSGRFLMSWYQQCSAFPGDPVGCADFYFRTPGLRISHLLPGLPNSSKSPCFALLPVLDSFSFSQCDKCVLPSKAERKEKIEMQSPSCILPRNATNLAFRLFAPFIKMPLRNLCRVSVHSFSLMKHQISFTNNSCVLTKHSGPSQHSCHLGQMQCVFQVCSAQNSLPPQ